MIQAKLRRIYSPMTETGFYILFCLQAEMHGYTIGQRVKQMTDGQGHNVWHTRQDGEGRYNSLRTRRGQAQNLPYHTTWPRDIGL